MSAAQPLPMSPGAILWVGLDWVEWLGASTIASLVVTLPAGITKLDQEVVGTVSRARIQLDAAALTDVVQVLDVGFTVTTGDAKPLTDTRWFQIQPTHRVVS